MKIPPFSSRALLACSSLLVLVACGDSSPTTVTFEHVTPAKFAEQYAQAQCERSGRCDNLAPYLVDQCKTQTGDRIHADDVQHAIDAGRMVFDEAQAKTCLEGIGNTRCLADAVDDAVLAACQGALQGKVESGGACSFLYECASGNCGGTEETTCPSTCPEVLHESDTCSTFRGPRCDTSAGLRCSGGTCVRPAELNAACVDNFGCKSGLLCVDEKCVPLATEGAGCSGDSSCAEGLYCQGSVCAVRKKEGQRCSASPDEVDAALRGAQCENGLVCQGAGLDNEGNFLPGTCVKPAKEAGSCQVYPQDVQIFLTGCLQGLDCTDSKCVLPPTSGPCNADFSCRSDQAYCRSDDNTCVTLLPDGADCEIPPQCASNYCPDGKCVPAVVFCHE